MIAHLYEEQAQEPEGDRKTEEIEAQVLARLNGRVQELRLLVHDSGIILQGRTRTYYAKQLAQHAVMEATDLLILANEIEVA